jgi:hypothetical protein
MALEPTQLALFMEGERKVIGIKPIRAVDNKDAQGMVCDDAVKFFTARFFKVGW